MDATLQRAVHGIAGELQVLAFEAGVSSLYEADLRSATRRALHVASGRKVVLEKRLAFTTWKPKTGKVDVAVYSQQQKGIDAAVELKWWSTAAKAAETLWDAWKLASAYKEELAWRTYLIAAASETTWRSAHPWVQLWEAGIWDSRKWWSDHPEVWKDWVTTKAGPLELPAGIRTTPIASVPIHVHRGASWELRCTKVTTTPGSAWPFPAA